MKTLDIDYSDGTLTMRGFLAYEDSSERKRPGVLVAPEAWGLGEHAMQRARMLAGLGYVAFALDPYGDRRMFSGMDEVMAEVGKLMKDPRVIRGRAKAALTVLASRPDVDGSRLGAIGFCMGGTIALELARAGEPLAGVVSFHGGLDTAMPAASNGIKSRVLVCTGADDPMIPGEKVIAFEDEMRKAGADWQVISYGDTVHSFTNPSADGSIPGVKYNKISDQRSWTAMQAFFAECFA